MIGPGLKERLGTQASKDWRRVWEVVQSPFPSCRPWHLSHSSPPVTQASVKNAEHLDDLRRALLVSDAITHTVTAQAQCSSFEPLSPPHHQIYHPLMGSPGVCALTPMSVSVSVSAQDMEETIHSLQTCPDVLDEEEREKEVQRAHAEMLEEGWIFDPSQDTQETKGATSSAPSKGSKSTASAKETKDKDKEAKEENNESSKDKDEMDRGLSFIGKEFGYYYCCCYC